MKALVVGCGSIGSRHMRILKELGHDTALVSRHRMDSSIYRSTAAALTQLQPDYVVIANRTHEHRNTLMTLFDRGYDGTVLVEKPLFHTPLPVDSTATRRVFVGYNLRFHPVMRALCAQLQFERVISAQVYAGQYLPTWRRQDYRLGYSARRAEGGGVLRDLSHELDATLHLFGHWQRVAAIGGRYSSLEIDSDDTYGLLIATNRCPLVSIQINYLDRAKRREILVNTDRHTYRACLIHDTLQVDDLVQHIPSSIDATYRAEHEAVLAGDLSALCTVEEALETLQLIDAAEQSASTGKWVTR